MRVLGIILLLLVVSVVTMVAGVLIGATNTQIFLTELMLGVILGLIIE